MIQSKRFHLAAGLVRRVSNAGWLVVAVLLFSGIPGCKSMNFGLLQSGAGTDDMTSTDHIQGPIQRLLARNAKDRNSYTVTPPEGLAEFEKALDLYEAEEYAQAEKAFKGIAKEYKESGIREDALFMEAESQYHRKRYAWAEESYTRVMKEYPSSRYLGQSSQRLFSIAREWLEFPTLVTTEEIQLADFEESDGLPTRESQQKGQQKAKDKEEKRKFEPSRSVPIIPNFFDKSRPVFDTTGRALHALKNIWINDPTGPLADDALMLTASHYFRTGDYMEADRYFQTLRENYTKSPHLKSAFILGSHVKLMSYQGPNYDGTSLEESRKLKESSLRLFADAKEKHRLRSELATITDALAARDWAVVEFYKKKRNLEAIATYCRIIIDEHPETQYADRARQLLAEINPVYAAELPRDERAPSPEVEEDADTGLKRFIPRLKPFPKFSPSFPKLLPIPSRDKTDQDEADEGIDPEDDFQYPNVPDERPAGRTQL